MVEDNRLTFNAELAVRCGECGEVFEFLGMQTGISQTNPTTGINGTTARLPIAPARLRQDQSNGAQQERPVVPGVRQGRIRKSVNDVPRPPQPVQSAATPVVVQPIVDISNVAPADIAGGVQLNELVTPNVVLDAPAPEPVVEQAPEPHTPEPAPEPIIEQAPEPHTPEPEPTPEPVVEQSSTPTE